MINNPINNNNNNNNDDHHHLQNQQTPRKPQQKETAPALTTCSTESPYYPTPTQIQQQQQYDLRSIAGQQQQQTIIAAQQQRIQHQTPHDRAYSGVDKLILAAMYNDARASQHVAGPNNHLASTGFIPSGRGIGYSASQRDSCAQIPNPGNGSEYELYRLLERANLLNYFGTFLNFGGDDVQQLYDADEDEFLEIMNLVGMTHKPLHVRRLQKALIEWKESKDIEISMLRSTHLNYIMTQQPAAPQPPSSANYNQTPNTTGLSSVPRSLHNPIDTPVDEPQPTMPSESNQYIPPRDLLVGAPKRIRLMDSLNDRERKKSDKSCSANVASVLNQPPFKKRFGRNLSSSPMRRSEERSDDNGSDEDDEIEVMNISESDFDESEEDEIDVTKSGKLTRADDRGLPVEAKDDNDAGHREAVPSKRSQPDQLERSWNHSDSRRDLS